VLEKRTILFSGRVQGVGFRATTAHLAARLPLAGTVENLPDGRVQLVALGEPAAIDALVDRLREHFASFLRTVDQHVHPAPPPAPVPPPGVRIVH
jgi:acylphosphatase